MIRGLTELKVLLEQIYIEQASHQQKQIKKRSHISQKGKDNSPGSWAHTLGTRATVGVVHSALALRTRCIEHHHHADTEKLSIKCYNYKQES